VDLLPHNDLWARWPRRVRRRRAFERGRSPPRPAPPARQPRCHLGNGRSRPPRR